MGEILKEITCSATECLCWIQVLTNIFAIFYLVYCSFGKVNKAVKVIGWLWLVEMLAGTVGLLVFHTCLYTLLATIFTVMIMMAILFVILPGERTNEEEKQKKAPKLGSYLISKTDEGRYVFGLYDASKNLIAKSKYSYKTINEAKNEINNCRDNGMLAAIEKHVGTWVKEDNYPTFEITVVNGKYIYKLNIDEEYEILTSKEFSNFKACSKMLDKAKILVASGNVYMNTERELESLYVKYGECDQEPIKEEPVVIVKEEQPAEVVKAEPVKVVVEVKPAESAVVIEEPAKEEVKEEPEQEMDKEGFDINTKSFEEKLKTADKELKERYEELKNELLQYGAKSRISYSGDTLRLGRVTVAKFGIKRTSLSLYLALNPADYAETKYSFTDVSDVKKYEQVPMKLKIRSNRAVKWAKELIEVVMTNNGAKKD